MFQEKLGNLVYVNTKKFRLVSCGWGSIPQRHDSTELFY